MSSASIHSKLERVRKPRVHIKYEVHTGDATVEKELPFVVGVLGDFSGNPTAPLRALAERKFIQIDRDNFNEIMAKMTPGANLKVANTLKGDGSEMSVQLKFSAIEDFEPAEIARQVEPLRKLLETREQAARSHDQGRPLRRPGEPARTGPQEFGTDQETFDRSAWCRQTRRKRG